MEVDFLETVHWNLLELFRHVTAIHMNLPMKQTFKCMHRYQENEKMVVGDGGWCALEFFEITWACYNHLYAYPPKTSWQMDAWFSSYGKNKFLLYVFFFRVVKQSLLVVF